MNQRKSLKELNLLDKFLFDEAMDDPENVKTMLDIILLNTRGKHPELVSPELIELLKYMERSTDEVSGECKSKRIQEMHRRVCQIKASEKTEVKYMQSWEEKILIKQEGIFICTSFNFCTINKNGFSGNFSHIKQCIRHFCKDTFRTGSISDQDRRYILFIPEAGEDVEFFVNGTSQGIQILPPFLYDITEAVQDGENDIRIEVATTLERERGANKENRHRLGFIVR